MYSVGVTGDEVTSVGHRRSPQKTASYGHIYLLVQNNDVVHLPSVCRSFPFLAAQRTRGSGCRRDCMQHVQWESLCEAAAAEAVLV